MSHYMQDPGNIQEMKLANSSTPKGFLFGVLSGLQVISPSFLFGFELFYSVKLLILHLVARILIPNDIDLLTTSQGDETTSPAIFAGPKLGPVSVLFNRSKNPPSMRISVPKIEVGVQEHSDLWSNWKWEDLLGSDHGQDAWGALCEGPERAVLLSEL